MLGERLPSRKLIIGAVAAIWGLRLAFHLLLVFIHGGHAHRARYHAVAAPAGIAGLIDPRARRKRLQLDLLRQHGGFVIVQEREQWNLSQRRGVTGHPSPRYSL